MIFFSIGLIVKDQYPVVYKEGWTADVPWRSLAILALAQVSYTDKTNCAEIFVSNIYIN